MEKKLIKKYGKTKLIQILKELHPHLNRKQQELNNGYLRQMKFGSHPGPKTPPRAQEKGTAKKVTPPKTEERGYYTEHRQQQRAPGTPESAGSVEFSLPKTVPLPYTEQFLTTFSTIYDEFLEEMSTEFESFLNTVDIEGNPVTWDQSFVTRLYGQIDKICEKYHDVLYLLTNTTGLYEEIRKDKKTTRFGAERSTRARKQTQKMIQHKQDDHGAVDMDSKEKAIVREFQHTYVPIDAIKYLTRRESPTSAGKKRKINPFEYEEVKNSLERAYKYTDTSGTAMTLGWENTIKQNGSVNDKENNRCALCGSYMLNIHENDLNPTCHHSQELEHQIPGSKALNVYIDIWREIDDSFYEFADEEDKINEEDAKIIGLEFNKIPSDETVTKLARLESFFFYAIGGAKAYVENRFVYCCTLCNQQKSDMNPFIFNDSNSTISVNSECLEHFQELLKDVLVTTLTERPSFLDESTSKQTRRKCNLVRKYKCALIWVIQYLSTYFLPELIDEKWWGPFPASNLDYLYKVLEKWNTKIEKSNKVLEKWNTKIEKSSQPTGVGIVFNSDRYYNSSTLKQIFFNKPIDEIQEADILRYYGRTVDAKGKTGNPAGKEETYQYITLEAKYEDILINIRKRLDNFLGIPSYEDWGAELKTLYDNPEKCVAI